MINLTPRFNPAIGLYRVDTTAAVSKYVGETEKSLNKAFDKVDSKGNSLYFDEADALFGKRSSVQETADRFKSLAGPVRPGEEASLNPQPLPPKAHQFAASSLLRRTGDEVSLNPQPLPPKAHQFAASSLLRRRGDAVSLNPQPLPPKENFRTSAATQVRSGDAVSLNPQPLPPKAVQNLAERLYRW